MTHRDIITLALSRAHALSGRTGVGWVIADGDGKLISCDATVAGFNPRKLEMALRRDAVNARQLFISVEPTSGVFEIRSLIESIEDSGLAEITLAEKLPQNLSDKVWCGWAEHWNGRISLANVNSAVGQINYGVQKLRGRGKPWVTCVTAASLTGVSQSLNCLSHQFGFIHFISDQVKQSRAVFYTRSQIGVAELLSRTNTVDEEIDYFEVDSNNKFDPLLRYCAEEQRYNVVVLADMQALAYLIDQNLVDEIVHHVSNVGDDGPHLTSADEHERVSHSLLNLRQWKLISSSVVDECSRMILCRKAPNMFSERRSN